MSNDTAGGAVAVSPEGSLEGAYDVIVMGFGKAGKTIAMKRAKAGDRVALVEQSPAMFGGTCINIGCVPTKKLLHEMSAHEALVAANCGDSDAGQDSAFATAVERRNALIAKMNAANKAMADGAGVVLVVGRASFHDKNSVTVTGEDGVGPPQCTDHHREYGGYTGLAGYPRY